MTFDVETAQVNGTSPKVLLAVGESRPVESYSNGAKYELKRMEDYYTCRCPAWKFANGSAKARTCKHLKELLGEEYESVRCAAAATLPAIPMKRRTQEPSAGPSSQNTNAQSSKKSSQYIIGGGARELMLASTWDLDGGRSPKGMWASEKLDGVRCYWDGQSLWSRNGKRYEAPRWWARRLPADTHLDGELFAKRDNFDQCSGVVRSGPSDRWNTISYLVFDAPDADKAVEGRWEIARSKAVDGEMSVDDVIRSGGSKIAFLPQTKIESSEHLNTLLDEVEVVGGEGLMLRVAASRYEGGRSNSSYKVKKHYDAEAVVIGYNAGEGRNRYKTGSLQLRMACGKIFDCGSGLTDSLREHPPALGSVVVYRFQELSHELTPRFPRYMGVAPDKTKAKDALVRSTLLRYQQSEVAASQEQSRYQRRRQ